MIVGKEEIKLFSKTYSDEDDYGNPIESENEEIIKNVLVGHDSYPVITNMFEKSPEIDVTIYIAPSWKEKINNESEFEYRGRRFVVVDAPILWETFKGSRLKPKLIVGLKYKQGV